MATAVLTGVLVPVTPVGIPVLAAAWSQSWQRGWSSRATDGRAGRTISPALLIAAVGYLLKLARISLPTGLLEVPLLARIAGLLPVALRPGSSPQALSSPWWSTLASSGLALPWQLCCCASRSWESWSRRLRSPPSAG